MSKKIINLHLRLGMDIHVSDSLDMWQNVLPQVNEILNKHGLHILDADHSVAWNVFRETDSRVLADT